MTTIKVCGSDTVCAEIRRIIRNNGLEDTVDVRAAGEPGTADIFIAAGKACASEPARVFISATESGAIELPCAGECSVVTVGIDSRNTLTPSSMLHEGGMAALQRELLCLDGQIVGPREIDLTRLKGSITEKMAVAAAMLVLNANAEW